jgi:hypothetical protein
MFHSANPSPDVIDQDIQAAVLVRDTRDQRLHLRRIQMINLHGDALAARVLHELGRLFNRFRTVVLRALRARGAPSAVDGRSSRTQLNCDAAARAARCSCYQRHFSFKLSRHHSTPLCCPPGTDA